MEPTRELNWGCDPCLSENTARSVLVIGAGKSGKAHRGGLYRALSGVSFQDLDMYVRQTSSCQNTPPRTEGNISQLNPQLDYQGQEMQSGTPYPLSHISQYGHQERQVPCTQPAFYSLGPSSGRNMSQSLQQDSLEGSNPYPTGQLRHPITASYFENSPYCYPNQPMPYHPSNPYPYQQRNYMNQEIYPTNPPNQYFNPNQIPPTYPMPEYPQSFQQNQYNQDNFQHNTYQTPAPYPSNYGYNVPASPFNPQESHQIRSMTTTGSDSSAIYMPSVQDSQNMNDSLNVNSYHENNNFPADEVPADLIEKYEVRKASVLSADSLEKLENLPLSSTSVKHVTQLSQSCSLSSEQNKEVPKRPSCQHDSLEEVRPRLVSELKTFFEKKTSSGSVCSEQRDSRGSSMESTRAEEKLSKEFKDLTIDEAPEANAGQELVEVSPTKEYESNLSAEESKDHEYEYEDKDSDQSHIGDVSFLRATKDTPLTLLASTRLVKATMRPPFNPTTFFIALEPKYKIPEFEESKNDDLEKPANDFKVEDKEEEENNDEDTLDDDIEVLAPERSCSNSPETCPADYQESHLQLRNFVSDWTCVSPSDNDSEIDEFFLVLDSTSYNDKEEGPMEAILFQPCKGTANLEETFFEAEVDPLLNDDDINNEVILDKSKSVDSDENKITINQVNVCEKEITCIDEKESFLDKADNVIMTQPFLGLGRDRIFPSPKNSILLSKSFSKASTQISLEDSPAYVKYSLTNSNSYDYRKNYAVRISVLPPTFEHVSPHYPIYYVDTNGNLKIIKQTSRTHLLKEILPVAVTLVICCKDMLNNQSDKSCKVISENAKSQCFEDYLKDGVDQKFAVSHNDVRYLAKVIANKIYNDTRWNMEEKQISKCNSRNRFLKLEENVPVLNQATYINKNLKLFTDEILEKSDNIKETIKKAKYFPRLICTNPSSDELSKLKIESFSIQDNNENSNNELKCSRYRVMHSKDGNGEETDVSRDEVIEIDENNDKKLRKCSESSGISSFSGSTSRKMSYSSELSSPGDDWKWFPQQLENKKDFLTAKLEDQKSIDLMRQDSNTSHSSYSSSGIGSWGDRKMSTLSGISVLSNITEEMKFSSNAEWFDVSEELSLNISVDGEPLSLPSPVWPLNNQELNTGEALTLDEHSDKKPNDKIFKFINKIGEERNSNNAMRIRRKTLHIFDNLPYQFNRNRNACANKEFKRALRELPVEQFLWQPSPNGRGSDNEKENYNSSDEDNESIQGLFDSGESILSVINYCEEKLAHSGTPQNDYLSSSDSEDEWENHNETFIEDVFKRNKVKTKKSEKKCLVKLYPLRDSRSLPNLSDIGEANLLDEPQDPVKKNKKESLTSIEEIVPRTDYDFSEVFFPGLNLGFENCEEQEVTELFSDEDLLSDVEFEPFSESEHDSDMGNLNLDLFEPKFERRKRMKALAKELRSSPNKIDQLKRKLSFNSESKSKEIRETLVSSLQRFKRAKQKIGKIVQKTLGVDPKFAPYGLKPRNPSGIHINHCGKVDGSQNKNPKLLASSLRACIEDRSYLNEDDYSTKLKPPSPFLDRLELIEGLNNCVSDGESDSIYSWSDAGSDFEFIDTRRGFPSRSAVTKSLPRSVKLLAQAKVPEKKEEKDILKRIFSKSKDEGAAKDKDRVVRLGHRSSNRIRNVPLPSWEPLFCVLQQGENTLTHYRSEEMAIGDAIFYDLPRVRLDGGSKVFRRRWGYEGVSHPPTLLEEEGEEDPYSVPPLEEGDYCIASRDLNDNDSLGETRSLREDVMLRYCQDTSYEKACGPDRRGSAPATPILGMRPQQQAHDTATPNRFVNFFNKRSFKNNPLKRTKSVTKLERSKRGIAGVGGGSTLVLGGSNNPVDQDPLASSTLSRLRSSRSHESLLATHQQMMHTLDMAAGEVTIKPLHPSVLGQDHCFQILSPSGTRYYSCRNSDERDKWVESLRRAVNPHMDKMRRTENSLKIFVLEAKGVAPKKKYFCEITLDSTLYGRTSAKTKGEMCFWGEQFDFKNLPKVESISVCLFREGDRRRKKDKNASLGSISIPISNVTSRSLIEKWYHIKTDNSKSKEPVALRIKCKFQTVDILPLDMYSEFLQYVKSHYWSLCSLLEPIVSVKAKEDIGTTLVHIMQREGLAKNFMADLVMMEIDRIDDAHLLFRGNSLATKAMEAFMKLVGEKYLLDTLRQVINKIVDDGLDCEVDPTKVPQISSLQKHQENLIKVVRMTWTRILNSHSFFPKELRQCFFLYRERLDSAGKGSLSDNLISASIFLRFLCPAILSPSLFNITQEYPDERTSRNLTLIAKTLQTLANFTKFQGKENFMEFMNDFIEKEQGQMRSFLQQISSPLPLDHRGVLEYDGEIDIGVQLSTLHKLLCEALQKVSLANKNQSNHDLRLHLEKMQTLLDTITNALKNPNVNIVQQISNSNSSENTMKIISPRGEVTKADESCIYQSLQRNIFRYNDPTVDLDTLRGSERSSSPEFNKSHETSEDSPSTPRSSTLPRTSFLLGSARKPAADLSTTDDYVLFSAFEPEDKAKGPHPIGHSFSHSHLASPNSQLGVTQGVHSHHHHFHNHAAWYNNRIVYDPIIGYHPIANQGQPQNVSINGRPTQDEPDRNSSNEVETNMKGSQTSISQLSNVASSGYQSFAYSQSSSPVDPSISHHDAANNNLNTNHANFNGNNNNHHPLSEATPIHPIQHSSPLAFNNPMYHINSPRSKTQCSPFPHHHHPSKLLRPLPHQSPISSSLSSSHSTEDLPSRSIINSTSSEDSPPMDVRFSFYKSSAPRTNPRYKPNWGGCEKDVNKSTLRDSTRDIANKDSSKECSRITPLIPDHYHSASDLLMGSQGRRPKAGRRQSTENQITRRLQRHLQVSDTSSDDEEPQFVPSRQRMLRTNHQRGSDSKTLDEYEKEILALRSSMELHLQMVMAEDRKNAIPAISTVHHRSNSRLASSTPKIVPMPMSSNGSNTPSSSSSGTGERVRHGLGEKSMAKTPPSDGENFQMRELLKTLIESHEELMRDQKKKAEMMNEKDAVIMAQEERISALNRSNTQLLVALSQIQNL